MNPTVLHLCSYYSGSKIYKDLVHSISTNGLNQLVYVAVRSQGEVGKNAVNSEMVKVIYDNILRKSDRVFFHKKINKIYKNLDKAVDLSNYDLIHAHTLFSDGAVALKVFQQTGKPYIVAVRNTDINIFWRYMPHLRKVGMEILKNAFRVVFINSSYRDSLIKKTGYSNQVNLLRKSVILPNGVDGFWHLNTGVAKVLDQKKITFLYVGDYSANKNIPFLVHFTNYVASKNPSKEVILNLVGGGVARGRAKIDSGIRKSLAQNLSDNLKVTEIGKVTSKPTLREIYREADFYIMLSKRETFGLVYIEAMSQGTPVIYTKGQGISGYFEDFEVGFEVELKSDRFSDIFEKLTMVMNDYNMVSSRCISLTSRFKWEDIAVEYIKIYSELG